MDYCSTIKVKDVDRYLYECLCSQEHKEKRSEMSFSHKNGLTIVDIECSDAVALRATLNTISRLISVFEQAKKLKQE